MAARHTLSDEIPFGPTEREVEESVSPLLVGLAIVVLIAVVGVVFSFVGCHGAPPVMVVTNTTGEEREDTRSTQPLVYVHVVGCVAEPGVYPVAEGSHVIDAIEQAGGFTEEADSSSLNLARTVTDGEQVRVYSKEEVQAQSSGEAPSRGIDPSGKVNINLASADELKTVSGIGEVTAKRIVEDRDKNGPFASVDDLARVSGIGEKTVARMRDSLTV